MLTMFTRLTTLRVIQFSFVFVTLVVFSATAMGDAFDLTVNQIRTLRIELEEKQQAVAAKRPSIEDDIADFRKNHALNTPQDEFESDEDYAARLKRLDTLVLEQRATLARTYLSPLLARSVELQSQIALLYRRVFVTDDVSTILGGYDANNEILPITFHVADRTITTNLKLNVDEARNLKTNWTKVRVTAWIVIHPEYQRGVARLKLDYPLLWTDDLVISVNVDPEIVPWRENKLEVFSPDGSYRATSTSFNVSLIEVNSGNTVWQISNDFTDVVIFSPDGRYLAIGDDWNGTHLVIREVSTGNLVWSRDSQVTSASFSPDGRYLVTGDENRYDSGRFGVYIWKVSSNQLVREIQTQSYVYSVAFSPNGRHVAIGQRNDDIDIYRIGDEEINESTPITLEKSIDTGYTVHYLSWSPDGLFISDNRKVYRPLLDPILMDLVPKPLDARRDVNGDGVVDVNDLVLVASNFSKSFAVDANPNPDVTRDGVVDLADLLEIVIALNAAAAAPSSNSHTDSTLTAKNLQHYVDQAKQFNVNDLTFQKGVAVLEHIIATLTASETVPTETALFPNYPNPFNPETWIPYQLAAAADVTLTLYDVNGRVVRTLELGHQRAGIYQDQKRAAYWDGRNMQAEPVASGVYFYTLTAGEFTATRKLLILK